jgi:hypothetical protein
MLLCFFQFLLTQLLGGIKLSEDAEIVLCSSHDSQYCTLWENSGGVKNYWNKACIYPVLIREIFSRYGLVLWRHHVYVRLLNEKH